jgi:hypothetical protein
VIFSLTPHYLRPLWIGEFFRGSLDKDWLVPADDAKWLSGRVGRIVNCLIKQQRQSAQITHLLDSVLSEFDDEDDENSISES